MTDSERREATKLKISSERLLADKWASSVLERIEAGDRLSDFSEGSEWRRLVDIADLKSLLDIPNLGWPIHSWMSAPVILVARKMLGSTSGSELDADWLNLFQDGILPSIIYGPALDETYSASNVVNWYYHQRRWYLSTILPAWSDYANNEDTAAIVRDLDSELAVRCELNGEAAGRASDLLWPYLVHHGIVAGTREMFVMPYAMEKAGVDIRDVTAMREAIDATSHWQGLFREYVR
ncbi:MAG: hypothetical protein AAGE03_05630 [Pseudomonadota bacterium]